MLLRTRGAVLAGFLLVAASSAHPSDNAPSGAPRPAIAVTLNLEGMIRLPSRWPDYFGTHYASTPEGVGRWWNTVRSYGGTHVGIYATDDSPSHVGPFDDRTVRVGLADFHSKRNRGDRAAEQLIPDLLAHRFTAIYPMTTIVRPTLEPFDKDLAYWAVYQIHKTWPDARRYVAWQIGNEVLSAQFDPKNVTRQGKPPEVGPDGTFHGYDLKWKEDYYVEDYLAPAIEAIRRASQDVYGDPARIKILLGSMNPYNRQNVVFLDNVMRRKFAGRQASSLAGKPVSEFVDVLTVHYMFGSEGTVARMQHYVDTYLKPGKVDAIWMTEEHGARGGGPVTVVRRGLRFLAWAAHNRLDADQTRMVWWGDGARKPGGSARDAIRLLGDFLSGRTLHLLDRKVDGGHVYILCAAKEKTPDRVLVAVVPERGAAIDVGPIRLDSPEAVPANAWQAELIQYSATAPPDRSTPTLQEQNGTLSVPLDRAVAEPLLVLFQRPDVADRDEHKKTQAAPDPSPNTRK